MLRTEMRDYRRDPHALFLLMAVAYVVLLSMSVALGMGLFRALSYVVAIFMPVVLAIGYADRRKESIVGMGIAIALLLYYYGLIGSLVFNYKSLEWPVAIKFLLAPLFLIIGAKVESRCGSDSMPNRRDWLLFGLVAVLPLAVLALQLIKGANVFARGADFSIFANRNNAALFAVALLGLYSVLARRPMFNVLVYLAVGAAFGTLGVLIALIFSLMVLVAKRENIIRYSLAMALAGIVLLVLIINDVWIFERFKPVLGTIELLVDPRVNLATMSYERLFHLLNTTDLSLAFRIKHWYDLADLFTSASVYSWVLGMGVGSSAQLTLAKLVPHNDYLRILFECGIVTFIGFLALIVQLVKAMGRRWEAVPFLAIALYMLSENLVDNFLAMSIFYYSGGVIIFRLRKQAATQVHSATSGEARTEKWQPRFSG